MDPLYGRNTTEIARVCGVTVKTAQRWKSGATNPPRTSLMILTSDLGCFDPAFAGWTIRRGKLISPEGWEATAQDVLSLPLLRARIATYQAEERRALAMEEQPAPGAVPMIRA
jgi:transcriptional regulator with XRE-family HTH domain